MTPRPSLRLPGFARIDTRSSIAAAASATLDLFLLHQLGFDDLTLYDGSMGECARDPSLPIEKG